MKLRLLVASLLLALTHIAGAQGDNAVPEGQPPAEETAPAPAKDEPAKPEPIAAADIASQAEATSSRLRKITKLAEPVEATGDIVGKLPATTEEVLRISRELAASPPVSLRGVSSARQHWSSLNGLLEGWQSDLQRRSTALQEAQDELDATQETWKASRSDDLPQPVLQQIDSILSELDTTKAAVAERMKSVLTLQGEVSKQRDATSEGLGELEEIESAQRSNLLVRDQDPLWRAFADARDLPAGLSGATSAIRSSLREFIGRYKGHAAVHGVLFVVLIIVIWLTRSAVTTGAMSDREVQRVSVVLTRPFSTALLISMLPLRFIYPVASPEVLQIARVILLIPLLRLLPKLMPKVSGLLYFLVVIFVVESGSQLVAEGSLLQRLMLLVATVLAIVALVAGLRRVRRKRLFERVAIRRLVLGLVWLAVIGLLASVAANVLGTMALASLLANAIFNGIWAAALLRVAVDVLSSVLMLVFRSPVARVLRSVRESSDTIHRRTMGVLELGAVLFWIILVLMWLQVWQPVLEWCGGAIEHEWVIGTLKISVGGIVAFVITIVVAVLVSKLVRFFLAQDVLSRLSLPRGAPDTILTLVHYTIIGVGGLIAFAASGMDLSKLGFIVGALGVGIGFGLQNIVNNFVSGLILIFERPVKIGDLISLGEHMGNVTRIGARSSTVKTFDGAEVIVPNGNLISSEVTNWTGSDQKRRTEVMIPVPFGTDPRRVIEILERVANAQEDVLDDPEPYAAFQAFDQNGMVFVVRAWPKVDASRIALGNALIADSIEALHEAGIEVPRPQREVHIRRDEAAGGDSEDGDRR